MDVALEVDDQWFDAVSDLEGDPFTNLFDEFGDYFHHVIVMGMASGTVFALSSVVGGSEAMVWFWVA